MRGWDFIEGLLTKRKTLGFRNSFSSHELVVEAEPSPDDIRALEDSIYAFNVRATGVSGGKLFAIFLRDEARVAIEALLVGRGRRPVAFARSLYPFTCAIRAMAPG
jgi:hypothetical protein